jgi:hypothetical protein
VSVVIASQICDPIIIKRMEHEQQKAFNANNDKRTPPVVYPFWANKPILDNIHPALQLDIARGAIPNEYIATNIRLGLHEAQAIKLAQILSELLIQRSHFIHSIHYKLHVIGRAKHSAVNESPSQPAAGQEGPGPPGRVPEGLG